MYLIKIVALIQIALLLPLSHANSQPIQLTWQSAYSEGTPPPAKAYRPATVPGSCLLDFINQEQSKKGWHYADNVDKYLPLEGKTWWYQTQFKKPDLTAGQALFFNSKGIDYEFEILLNQKKIYQQEGMFTPVRLRLDTLPLQANNTLLIKIYPIPIAPGQPTGRRQAILAVKPPVPYGWDWHPRIVPIGIWQQTQLSIEPANQIATHALSYHLSPNFDTAHCRFAYTLSQPNTTGKLTFTLSDPAGQTVFKTTKPLHANHHNITFTLPNPQLWYPHDHGNQPLYNYTAQLITNGKPTHTANGQTGFRSTQMVMNHGAWNAPQGFPKSRSVAPFQLVVNGLNVFAKGSNWVHPEVFYGTLNYQRYLEQLLLVKQANMNIVRIWGGGIVNKDSFFSICDSLGIMVWQEFPLACNPYPNDSNYIKVLKQEAVSIIKQVRTHPSLVMWSGGNELFNRWSGMTEQSHALRLLNSLCYQLDRNTPFIYTSPLYGVGHGHYIFKELSHNEDVFQRMARANNTAYTEFGMPSLAPKQVLQKIIPQEELFPLKPTQAYTKHHAFGAWNGGGHDQWASLSVLKHYFGEPNNIDELLYQSNLLQSMGYKAIYEEARRQKPYCSMAINWCFQEPWPTAANNSLVAYPNIKKPAYHAVQQSLRPQMASLAFSKFDWPAGQYFETDVWFLNDQFKSFANLQATVTLQLKDTTLQMGTVVAPLLQPNSNVHGATLRKMLPQLDQTQLAKVKVSVANKPNWNSEYTVLIRGHKPIKLDPNLLNF